MVYMQYTFAMKLCQEQYIFFGTSEFAVIVLEQLLKAQCDPLLVVTNPDELAGRKQVLTSPPVKIFVSQEHPELPIAQPEAFNEALREKLENLKPDFFAVASYGRLIPKSFLNIPVKGALNVHPSLLPLYRGPSPIQSAILEGKEKTGVSIMLLDEEMDHGPILMQKEVYIGQSPQYKQVHNDLAMVGGQLLLEVIPSFLAGTLVPIPQNHGEATYTKLLKKENGRIDWNKDALYIERQIRAFHPWPGTFSFYNGQLLKILKGTAMQMQDQKPPGTVFIAPAGAIGVYAQTGAIALNSIQTAGGKPMPAKEFILGHKELIGTILQ